MVWRQVWTPVESPKQTLRSQLTYQLGRRLAKWLSVRMPCSLQPEHSTQLTLALPPESPFRAANTSTSITLTSTSVDSPLNVIRLLRRRLCKEDPFREEQRRDRSANQWLRADAGAVSCICTHIRVLSNRIHKGRTKCAYFSSSYPYPHILRLQRPTLVPACRSTAWLVAAAVAQKASAPALTRGCVCPPHITDRRPIQSVRIAAWHNMLDRRVLCCVLLRVRKRVRS